VNAVSVSSTAVDASTKKTDGKPIPQATAADSFAMCRLRALSTRARVCVSVPTMSA
jgi:hypothetical protein